MRENKGVYDNMYQPQKILPVKFKIFVKKILWKYRELTWPLRKLPDFLVIGAMKSGTTSLYSYLIQHPQISKPQKKEIYFFSTNLYNKGIHWYRAHFPFQYSSNQLTFEASTDYIFVPKAAELIYRCLPDVKLILLLRNPVDRAISHYFHQTQRYRERLSILEALAYENNRIPSSKALMERVTNIQNYKKDPYIVFSYKSRGLYIEQVKKFLQYFPKERLFIVNSEKLYSQPDYVMKQIYHFLGIESNYIVKDFTPKNVTSDSVKSYISEDVYQYLNDYFEPFNRELYELIDHDFNW